MEYSNEAIELVESVLLVESERWQYRYSKMLEEKRKKISDELSDLKKETNKMAKDLKSKNPEIDVDKKEYSKKLKKIAQLNAQMNELPSFNYSPNSTFGLNTMAKGTEDKDLRKEYSKMLKNNQIGVKGKRFDGSFIKDGKSYTPMGEINKTAKQNEKKKKGINYQINKNTEKPGTFSDPKINKRKTTKEIKKGLSKEVKESLFDKLKKRFNDSKNADGFIDKIKVLLKGKSYQEATIILTEALNMILEN